MAGNLHQLTELFLKHKRIGEWEEISTPEFRCWIQRPETSSLNMSRVSARSLFRNSLTLTNKKYLPWSWPGCKVCIWQTQDQLGVHEIFRSHLTLLKAYHLLVSRSDTEVEGVEKNLSMSGTYFLLELLQFLMPHLIRAPIHTGFCFLTLHTNMFPYVLSSAWCSMIPLVWVWMWVQMCMWDCVCNESFNHV